MADYNAYFQNWLNQIAQSGTWNRDMDAAQRAFRDRNPWGARMFADAAAQNQANYTANQARAAEIQAANTANTAFNQANYNRMWGHSPGWTGAPGVQEGSGSSGGGGTSGTPDWTLQPGTGGAAAQAPPGGSVRPAGGGGGAPVNPFLPPNPAGAPAGNSARTFGARGTRTYGGGRGATNPYLAGGW